MPGTMMRYLHLLVHRKLRQTPKVRAIWMCRALSTEGVSRLVLDSSMVSKAKDEDTSSKPGATPAVSFSFGPSSDSAPKQTGGFNWNLGNNLTVADKKPQKGTESVRQSQQAPDLSFSFGGSSNSETISSTSFSFGSNSSSNSGGFNWNQSSSTNDRATKSSESNANTSQLSFSASSNSSFNFGDSSKLTKAVPVKKAATNSLADLLPAADNWECPTCMVSNKATSAKCVSCEEPNPVKPSARSSSSNAKQFGAAAFSFGSSEPVVGLDAHDDEPVVASTPVKKTEKSEKLATPETKDKTNANAIANANATDAKENYDKDSSLESLKLGAEAGNVSAQYELGLRYCKGDKQLEKDVKQAAEWFRKASGVHSGAQFELACILWSGHDSVAKDVQRAIQLYTDAANLGHAEAQFNLGCIYQRGENVSTDKKQACMWYNKAAEQGHKGAQFNLGAMYQQGDGISRDVKRATELFQQAAAQGHAKAQFNLGVLHEHGAGVAKDLKLSTDFYGKAAKQGHADAQNRLQFVRDEMAAEAEKKAVNNAQGEQRAC